MKYIRLIEIINTQELTMIKLALNKENINYKTLFENTLRTAEAYALGNNGAIIEVSEEDFVKSKKILSGLGIELNYDAKEDRFGFINKIEEITENLPIIGRIAIGYRFFLIATISILIVGAIVLLNIVRISKSELVGSFWCVEEIIHNGKKLQPNTTPGVAIIGYREKCNEDLSFYSSGVIDLPGFDSYQTRGNWNFKTEKIFTISGLTNFKDIYEGQYTIKTYWNGTMEFVSDKTTIKISRKY